MATLRQLASRYDSPLEALSAYHAANRNGDRRAQAELEPLIHAIVEQYPDRGVSHFGIHYVVRGHTLISQPAPVGSLRATMPRFTASVVSESEQRPEPDGGEPAEQPANVVGPDDDDEWDDDLDDADFARDDSDEHPALPDQAVSLAKGTHRLHLAVEPAPARNAFGYPAKLA